MISEFELMRRMAACASVDGQDQLAELIGSTDFSKNQMALDVAVSCFLLTKENIEKNQVAAMKLLAHRGGGHRYVVALRIEVLDGLLSEIKVCGGSHDSLH